MIKGTTIQLVVEKIIDYDPFGAPIVETTIEDVKDVLVGQPSTTDIVNATEMYGKKVVYTLGIPKGDTHNWTNVTVIIWGQKYKTFGFPMTGIQENIPLRWGQNVMVERYVESSEVSA